MKTVNRIFGLVVALILLFSVASTTHGFATFEHWDAFGWNTLIRKVHAEEWRIGYRFREGCPDFYREKEERLKELITETLNVWMQPLREAYPQVAFTEKFVFVRQADFKGVAEEVAEEGLKEYHRKLNEVDMRVNFWCLPGNSTAGLHEESSPQADIQDGLRITREFIRALVHEIGHTFGLADTYVSPKAPEATRSTGGLAATSGKQPSSVMSYPFVMRELLIMEDDKRGIIWLYKHIHEGQPLDDCFFPEYIYEADPPGCRPKYPMIFEIKYGTSRSRFAMVFQDPAEANVQDERGLSALHYAVLNGDAEFVEYLLDDANADTSLRDEEGRTALDIARQAGHELIIRLILEHRQRPVDPRGKKVAVTWGELKRGN